jgi:hypothetical protein
MRLIAAAILVSTGLLQAQPSDPPAVAGPQVTPKSACHVFIDHQFIWTLEVTRLRSGEPGPILNIITFVDGQWDLRPRNIRLVAPGGREAEIEKFSIDTGVIEDPYYLQYLKVQGDSFIGLDLLGDFEGFEELAEVSIDLGNNRFILEPIDCLEFENVVRQINQVNFDSPDLRQDYEVLGLNLRGRREARRMYY